MEFGWHVWNFWVFVFQSLHKPHNQVSLSLSTIFFILLFFYSSFLLNQVLDPNSFSNLSPHRNPPNLRRSLNRFINPHSLFPSLFQLFYSSSRSFTSPQSHSDLCSFGCLSPSSSGHSPRYPSPPATFELALARPFRNPLKK